MKKCKLFLQFMYKKYLWIKNEKMNFQSATFINQYIIAFKLTFASPPLCKFCKFFFCNASNLLKLDFWRNVFLLLEGEKKMKKVLEKKEIIKKYKSIKFHR